MNDNIPDFLQDSYEAEVLENQPEFTSVLVVTATDKDVSLNEFGALRYQMSSANSAFVVDVKSGLISTRQVLDRETQGRYEFTVCP